MKLSLELLNEMRQSKSFKCIKPFDYLTVGQVYELTWPKTNKGDVYFRGNSGGTPIRLLQVYIAYKNQEIIKAS